MQAQLLAQGTDPDTALEVFRNGTLALKVRSIGEAAGLEIKAGGNGFRPVRQADAVPPMNQNRERVPKARSGATLTSETLRRVITRPWGLKPLSLYD